MSSPKLCCRCFQSIACNGFHHSLLQIEIKQSFHAEREPIFHGKWLFVKLSSKPAENLWTRLPKPATLLRVFGVNAVERPRDPDPLPALAQPGPPRTRAPASRHVVLSSFSLSYIDLLSQHISHGVNPDLHGCKQARRLADYQPQPLAAGAPTSCLPSGSSCSCGRFDVNRGSTGRFQSSSTRTKCR